MVTTGLKDRPRLRIHAQPVIWGAHGIPVPDASLAKKIMQRDGLCCYFCGYKSAENRVHIMNQDMREHAPENLALICWVCALSQNTESAQNSYICYLPDMHPADMANFIHTLFAVMRGEDEEQAADAAELLEWLLSHTEYTRLAFGTDKPADFAQALQRLPLQHDESILRHLMAIPAPVAAG